MSLARTNSPLSKLIVRNIGDVGGPRPDHVDAELDNIIAWAKNSPRNVRRDTATANSVGAGSSTLHTFSLPANSLEADGDYLTIVYGGNFAANDSDKIVNASFGGTAYVTGGAVDIDGGGAGFGWRIVATIIRLSPTSVRTNHTFTANTLHVDSANAVNTFTGSAVVFTRTSDITGLANLNSNATTMAVQGVGAANNDVVQNLSIIELCQQ